MPLLETNARRRPRTVSVTLSPQVADDLRQYARFANAKQDDVVGFALQRLFEQDKEFGPWCRENPAPEPRWRKSSGNGDGADDGAGLEA